MTTVTVRPSVIPEPLGGVVVVQCHDVGEGPLPDAATCTPVQASSSWALGQAQRDLADPRDELRIRLGASTHHVSAT